jgi:hypothetical protein
MAVPQVCAVRLAASGAGMQLIRNIKDFKGYVSARDWRQAVKTAFALMLAVACLQLVFIVTCLLLAASPAAAFTTGSGVLKSEVRTVGTFSRIAISGSMTLEVAAGQSVTVSGDDNLVPLVETTVSGNVLRIRFYDGYATSKPLVVKVAVPSLEAIIAWGAAKITASGIAGDRFDLEGNGATKATLAGRTGHLQVKLLGAGDVDACALETHTAGISITGAGNADVNARDTLDIRIIGAGKVSYGGMPVSNRTIIGAGSVQARK